MKIVARRDCTSAEWNRVVHESPDGWVWAMWQWQELIERVPRWQLHDAGFGVIDGDRLVAAVPLHWIAVDRRLSGSGFGLTAPAIVEAPADQRQRYAAAVFDEVRTLANRLGARRVEFALSPVSRTALANQAAVNPFVEFGFTDESGHTRVLHLAPGDDELLKGFSRDARQQIRKAAAAGYTARPVVWQEWLDEYYRVHCETYTRTGVTPHQREYFAGIAEHLAPLGHSVLVAAFAADGRPIAFHNTARLGAGAVYHTGCSVEEALDSGVNYLVLWEALRHARATGCEWYEIGEIFPGHTSGKTFGLTVFKSKFGGETRQSIRAGLNFEPAATTLVPPPSEQPAAVEAATPDTAGADSVTRLAYEKGALYAPSRICARPNTGDDWADRLLQDRLAMVAEHYAGGRLVDLCCATGGHIVDLAKRADWAIGIDFAARYVETANEQAKAEGRANVSFLQGDARSLPLSSGTVDCLYCFSSLYAIPRAEDAVAEIGRVLAPGGRAVLDFGNRRSLNAFCVGYYTEWPPIHPLTFGEIRRALARAGLSVVRRRCFQLLPLWADRPAWLWPLLHPFWKKLLRRRIFGRMADEWVSSLPGVRAFAFRHVIVCQKT